MKKIVLSMIFLCFCLLILSSAWAQTWVALPPYNILYPLWSPVLSPVDPLTGVPTPLISELSSTTVLPVQPVLGWNPNGYSWPMSIVPPNLFYNSPMGVMFFDAIYGLNPWPPSSFLDPVTGGPIPIALPVRYSYLPLLETKTSEFLVELANLTYMVGFGAGLGIDPTSLLTAAQIWGLPIW
jgi:hypothetical protein